MEKDQRLEEISDRIRMGIPVSLIEGIAAINYQEKLREHRKQSKIKNAISKMWQKIKRKEGAG